ncbi:hypothetical protein [Brevibacterium aurantiacum]|uniref:Uncharacterized protein n=1 Tax=Brevibacterium aurantiacum TaxID=273384 RepID=A0A2H1JII2_BREAU|nr:hypothetical protein [Brevibacterium aurantiacum]SMX86962.1 hypothetical protein BAUR920_02122 [Brevibacterium aurantiacum]SMY00373.1 hypothetical protein BAURA86_02949 [Brevibacterium aurantiacum]
MSTELVSQFSPDEAQELTNELRADYGSLQVKISTAWRGRIWLALGYESWQDYLDEEFRDVSLRPPKELQEQVIAELRAAGMSTRGIASATDLSQPTVVRRLNEPGDSNESPEKDEPVIGLDGKQYERERPPKPTSAPTPVGESIVDAEVIEDDESDDYDLVFGSGLEPASVDLNESSNTPGREHVVRAIRELHYGASAPLPMVKKQSKLLEVAFSGGVSDLATLEGDKVEDLGRDVADALGVLSDLLSAMATQPAPTFQAALTHSDTVGSIKKTMTNLQVITRSRS